MKLNSRQTKALLNHLFDQLDHDEKSAASAIPFMTLRASFELAAENKLIELSEAEKHMLVHLRSELSGFSHESRFLLDNACESLENCDFEKVQNTVKIYEYHRARLQNMRTEWKV